MNYRATSLITIRDNINFFCLDLTMNFFILLFSYLNNLYSDKSIDNTYQINKEIKVSFIIPLNNFLITDKVTNKTSIEDLKNIKIY